MTDNIIFGIYPVLEALRNGKDIDTLYIRQKLVGENTEEIVSLARDLQVPVHRVPPEKLNRMVRGNNQGVVAIMAQVVYSAVDEIVMNVFEQGKNPFIVVLDGITDVRNFGAIARSAECAAADCVVFSEKNAAPVNSVSMKASAGALSHIPVARVSSLVNTVKNLKDLGLKIIAVTEKANAPYYNFDFLQPMALVLGSEDEGIGPTLLHQCDESIAIPMKGKVQSLNVSVAAGIVFFEALKQRGI